MIRRRHAAPVAIVLLSVACLVADARQATVVKGWGEVIDPDGDCSVKADGERVTVNVPGTPHDYAAENGRWNAPRILSSVRDDFILEVKVAGSFKPADQGTIDGRRPYVGAGLLLAKDPKNYASLHRATVYLDGRFRRYANFEVRRDAEIVISRYEIELEGRDTYLRLERRGQRLAALISQDGVNWKSYEPIELDFPVEIKAGVVAVNSSKSPFACAFEGLQLYRKVAVEPGTP